MGENFPSTGELKLSSNGGEKLSSGMTYTIDTGLTALDGASSSVTLEGGSFVSGGTYYFVVAPGTLEKGLNISYKTADGETYAYYINSEKTFEMGKITDLGTLTESNFIQVLTNTAFIAKVSEKVTDIGWNKNNDGTVSLTSDNIAKMANVTELDLSWADLDDLSGIEYFTGLTSLDCGINDLTSLDVSALTKLASLDCSTNAITELDLTGLSSLTELRCNNNLSDLDLSDQTGLTTLSCSNNYNLTELDVSKLTGLETLYCYKTSIASLDIRGLENLMYLYCRDNSNLTTLTLSGNTSLVKLSCTSCALEGLDVSGATSLEELYCQSNRMKSLDITDNEKLTSLKCGYQTSDGTIEQELTLTLTTSQLQKWNSKWESLCYNVTASVGGTDASHEGFETQSSGD